jgi:hypothetical protein
MDRSSQSPQSSFPAPLATSRTAERKQQPLPVSHLILGRRWTVDRCAFPYKLPPAKPAAAG